jgi:hypothetical protein
MKKFAITSSAEIALDSNTGYSGVSTYLQLLGMIETSIEDCEGLIFINYNKQSYKKYKHLGKKIENLVLIRLEPKAVFPIQYRKSVEKKFGLIIDPGKKLEGGDKSDFIGWPYKYNLNPSTPKQNDPELIFSINKAITDGLFDVESWRQKADKIVLIAANKVSPTSNSNYKLRRKIAEQMTSLEIDIYGDLWDANIVRKILYRISVGLYAFKVGFLPNLIELYGGLFSKYANYIGKPENKHLIIQKYRYSLVIENSSDYCSEKLFDAIINGSIPIYIGPKNTEIFLPNNLFYSCTGSVDEIRKILNSVQEKDINDMLGSMKDFLQSKNFTENWSSEKVYGKIAQRIDNFWNIK